MQGGIGFPAFGAPVPKIDGARCLVAFFAFFHVLNRCRNEIFFTGPVAKVNQLATLGTEGHERFARVHLFFADGATHRRTLILTQWVSKNFAWMSRAEISMKQIFPFPNVGGTLLLLFYMRILLRGILVKA